jgi:hypothetical protein
MRSGRWNRRRVTGTAGAILAGLISTFFLTAGQAAAVSEFTGEQVYAYGTDGSPEQQAYDRAVTDSVTRVYLAVLDRSPDDEGLAYWVGEYKRGVALLDIGAAFMVSDEWRQRFGSVDKEGFVDLLYGNVLDRSADAEGRAYWLSSLNDGVARAEVVLQFSESAEFVAKTGTVDPLPPYPAVPADSGTGRRIVYANQAQRIWLIEEDGSVHDSYLVSGRQDRPGTGTYAVYSKSELAWAGHDGITMDHMVRFAHGRSLAIGFHSIPTGADGAPLQTLDQLGTYQSAGCVRQDPVKAAMLYQWADIGTTVIVLD